MKPAFWCFVFKHQWVETGRVEDGTNERISGECSRCRATDLWDKNYAPGKPPERPTWKDVQEANNQP